mgnify:CR=1 FL=1
MPFLGKNYFNQNPDDFGINIDLICAVFGIDFFIKILTILILGTPWDTVYPWGKAQTSKRVSVIACDNAISKVQLSGTPRDTVYSRGKGAHKQKSERYRLR